MAPHRRNKESTSSQRMTSARQVDANRRNAQASTGPKTAAGKARAAQNARRHGLTLAARGDPQWARVVADLARGIAGTETSVDRRERAERIAAAQAEVMRVRQRRNDVFAADLGPCDLAQLLSRIDRYERDALARRKFAIRDFDAASGSR